MNDYVIPLDQVRMTDVPRVGGKNASLGEMISQLDALGISVPGGFATTADAYREFLDFNDLQASIYQRLKALDVERVQDLAAAGQAIRRSIIEAPFQPGLPEAISAAWAALDLPESPLTGQGSVAVRSSATAEDLPDASFAGQQETFLNVRGLDAVMRAVKEVYASLFNDRAIAYRVHQGFDHEQVALSATVQRMVRSDLGASGVMFTLDTESGFRDAVLITGAYGLGETVVQGAVNPDEFFVYKPGLEQGRPAILRRTLGSKRQRMVFADADAGGVALEEVAAAERAVFCITDEQITALARQAVIIERHYGRPMDIEWALDGLDQKLTIVQARPETVQSRQTRVLERFELTDSGDIVTTGRSIGNRIGAGPARVILSLEQMDQLRPGDVLVTDMTDPDWEPVMKRAAAIVTNRGGRTCHAAIIARELGIPAVVGCGDATVAIGAGEAVTVSCAEGDEGRIYRGLLAFNIRRTELDRMPPIPVKLMMNVGNPDQAFGHAALPNSGVGLARLEFIIARMIGIHPRALLEFEALPEGLREDIAGRIKAYGDPIEFYVERLKEGIATIAAAFAPAPVIVRLSDFKSNEYANLLGGDRYEPREENPMIGFRGAGRYLSADFAACFELECRALKRVREDMGLRNVEVMVPFVRTVKQAAEVVKLLGRNGLRRGEHGLRLIMMCEIPSNALLAEQFLALFDGFSIGSNDLTQLTLGLDRDSGLVAALFDERDDAVKALLSMAISACRRQGKYIGICGQGPSDHPDLAAWLLEQGIGSMSLNPDSMVETWLYLARAAQRSS